MVSADIKGYQMHYEGFGDELAPALALIHGGLVGDIGGEIVIVQSC